MKDTLLTDETMELIAKLYSYMDEEEMASWSMEAAQEMGLHPIEIRTEIISEFIQQDAEL